MTYGNSRQHEDILDVFSLVVCTFAAIILSTTEITKVFRLPPFKYVLRTLTLKNEMESYNQTDFTIHFPVSIMF